MPLTDTFVKQVKHSGKAAGDKYSDGGGLYLHVTKSGRYWRMAYRFGGKQKTVAFGVYPAVTLAQARKRRDAAREQLASDLDPGLVKQAAKAARALAGENTFEAVAREYHGIKSSAWSESYSAKWLRLLEKDFFPSLGKLALADITPPMMLGVLRRVEQRGAVDAAHTLRKNAGQVFRYGIQTGRCERNPVPDLQGALKPLSVKHMAALLEPVKVGELMRAIDAYTGQPVTRGALLLSALLFQRPVNIRSIEWAWIDLDAAMLTIPAQEMKRTQAGKLNGRPHFVPLARQAVETLREMLLLTGHREHVFPANRGNGRPMSNMTINAALRRMGFSGDEMTAHGFRAMARTLMIERLPGIHADVIEAQLAHSKSGPLGAAYDRAEYMDQRRTMMQAWADYLDKLRQGADVLQFKKA
ncbi:tyrosine-type recombinase/integrase [Comamonas testosteroni]|uniref:tyrosine-type recombinase/integrase n=1 Tax=Comamonas testosteroni TaxID=285 RepID=UPI00391CDBC6